MKTNVKDKPDTQTSSNYFLTTFNVPELKEFQQRLFEPSEARPKTVSLLKSQFHPDAKTVSTVWLASSLEELKSFHEHTFNDGSAFNVTPLIRPFDPLIPAITRIFPFSRFTPGGGVILEGKHFGPQPGEIRLLGNFPGGFLSLDKLQWGDTFAAGVVPAVTGVADQPITVQVLRNDGASSLPVPASFTALRQTVLLPGTAVRKVSAQSVAYLGRGSFEPTISGWNVSVVFGSSGTDVFHVTLQNGWKYVGHSWGSQDGIDGSPFPGAEPIGSSDFDIRVKWFIGFLGVSMYYQLYIWVEGPIGGVPFN